MNKPAQKSSGKAKDMEDAYDAMRDESVERKKAPGDRFELAQHARNVHRYILPREDTLEDALETDYWTHIAMKLTVLDRIEINPDDGSFYAELLVRSLQFGMVVTTVLNHVEFDNTVVQRQPESDYRVKWNGPHDKWCVFQHDEKLTDKIETQSAAVIWLKDHQRAQRA